jgi:hypothetical protein
MSNNVLKVGLNGGLGLEARYIEVRKKITPLGPADLLFWTIPNRYGQKWPHFSLSL